MAATKIKKTERVRTGRRATTEPPWDVVLHNDWNNFMPRAVLIHADTITQGPRGGKNRWIVVSRTVT